MLNRLFAKSEFTKNTFVLIVGTVVAQSIPLLLHPFLRRIYSPEDFGAMAIYLSIFGMLSIILSLRYEATIVLPKNDNEAANILTLNFLINGVLSVVVLLIIIIFKTQIAHFINFPERHINYLYFLPFGASLFALYQSINFWLIRQKAFKASTNNKIVRRLTEGLTQGILGILKIPGGLIIGDLVGNFSNVIAGFRQAFKNKYEQRFVSKKKMAYIFKKHIEYPKYNVVPTLLSSAASTLPFLFINKIYSTETVGYLDLSRLVLSIPLIFIATTISQVFFQQITEKKHSSRSIKKDCIGILAILLTIIALEVIIIKLFGHDLFVFVFGKNYGISSDFSEILIFSFALNFIGSTFSSVFITFEKIKYSSIWQTFYFGAICTLIFFNNLSIFDFLKLYVLIEVLMHSVYIAMVFFIINSYEKKIIQ